MNNKLKVSIVMPVYNMHCTIERAINSILNQTFKDWELIIVNDGSTDCLNLNDLLIKYNENNKITICELSKNMGRSNAYNCGIVLAKNDLIALHNADDVYLPEKLERQIQHLKINNFIDVLGTGLFIGDHGKKNINPYFVDKNIYKKMIINHATIMFKKEWFYKVGGYDPSLLRCSDWDFCCKLFKCGAIMRSIDDVLYKWFPNKDNKNYQEYVIKIYDKWNKK